MRAAIEYLVHLVCTCVAVLVRLTGGYVHVGAKRPCARCEGRGAREIGWDCSDACDVCKGVNPEGRYIDRYSLFGRGSLLNEGGKWGNVWLQRIWRPDADRYPHDHPWHSAASIVLCGGYDEERLGPEGSAGAIALLGSGRATLFRELLARCVNMLPRGVYHRITWVRPYTWTLFVTGPAHGQGWGFLVDGKHVPSPVYLGQSAPGYVIMRGDGVFAPNGVDGAVTFGGPQRGITCASAALIPSSGSPHPLDISIVWDDDASAFVSEFDALADTEPEPATAKRLEWAPETKRSEREP